MAVFNDTDARSSNVRRVEGRTIGLVKGQKPLETGGGDTSGKRKKPVQNGGLPLSSEDGE